MTNRDEFIELVGNGAVEGWKKHKILPSISIAQAILESATGASVLAKKANNLFGIKGDYNGNSYNIKTWEVINGKNTHVYADFKKYPSWEASIADHGAFFTSTEWRKNNYKDVIGETDYKKAAQALSDAGYATDPNYPSKLIRLVEQHNLTEWDKKAGIDVKETKKEKGEPTIKWTKYLVAVDAGHGRHTPGKRSPAGEREWTFNEVTARALIQELQNYGIRTIRLDDPTGQRDVPLRERTNKANRAKADILVSIHHNANTGRWGNWTGSEVYAYPGTRQGQQMSRALAPVLARTYGIHNRGAKTANFHMLRESKMPSILTEGGFMDSRIDIVPMRKDSVLRQAGVEIAKVVANQLGVKKQSNYATTVTRTPKANKIDTSKNPYIVKSGDTLGEIAKAYGVDVNTLAKHNKLKNKNIIRVGQKISIPKKTSKKSAPKNTSSPTTNNTTTYKVKRGDTLGEIAKRYKTTVSHLARVNNLANPNLIVVGQELQVPSLTPQQKSYTYVVKRGDTLSKIAKTHNTTVNRLVRDNNIRNRNIIHPGQKLTIRTGKMVKQEHIVKRGETLGGIAKRYGTTVNELARKNSISNPNRIFPGQKIKL